MPIYEYECERCGRVDEILQKISDKPLSKCKHCSGKLHKLMSQNAFHLKGSGWYVTDYCNKKGNNIKGGETKTEHKDSDSTSSKTETTKTSND